MPDYLRSTRKTVASILWIPFSWLVQALVFALVGMAFTATLGFRGSVEPGTALLIIGLLPVLGLIAAAVAAFVVIRAHRGVGTSSIGLFLRAFFWFFSFPARGWLIGFGWALKFMVVYAIAVVIGFVGLLITWWAVSTMVGFGANGWLILLVGVGLPLLTVGGAAWGNQYGSGTTGGMPIGCVLIVPLAIAGGFFWFCLLLVILALFALPASVVLFGLGGGTLSMDWEWHEWAAAVGGFAVMVGPPFVVENFTRSAGREFLDRLPYLGVRRRRKRAQEARLAELRRQHLEGGRWRR
ncbi:hypothetical protein ACFWHT_10940 [Microbacterium sp. NPDC058342]|uniref:hypothetical protein n=1 Tax=Microbacterium sp. NPDC058342 TaxID=3346454 RepID=UPI0036471D04